MDDFPSNFVAIYFPPRNTRSLLPGSISIISLVNARRFFFLPYLIVIAKAIVEETRLAGGQVKLLIEAVVIGCIRYDGGELDQR
jgi:hypothetical protein